VADPGAPIAGAVDRLMDLAVLPGFSAIGYEFRRRAFGWEPPEVAGRTVMITGANAGLGRAASEALAGLGARVVMICRDPERGEEARRAVSAEADLEPELMLGDLSSMDSVRDLAGRWMARGESLDVLINNAGVMPPERTLTDEGFELTFATNVLGPFLLSRLLIPSLETGFEPRIVMVSSGGMYGSGFSLSDPQLERRDYRPSAVYAHTKRAEVMLADEFDVRFRPTACSMHPGWAETPGVAASLPRFNRIMGPVLRDPEAGADTVVWLAGASPAEAPGGLFYEDRRPRPKYRLPGTRERAADRKRLYDLCAELTGITD
jgi:dehydrogenase/reductase SDR family protein 12